MSGLLTPIGAETTASASDAVAFSALTAADRALYEAYADRTAAGISDLQFVSRMAWKEGFHYRKAEIGGALVIVAQRNVFTGPHVSTPLGLTTSAQLGRIVDRIWRPYADLSQALTDAPTPYLRFLFVPESQLPCFEGLADYAAAVEFDPDYSDYVYEAEKLRTLAGKAMHGKRNHWNRFCKDHPDIVYAPITAADAPEALALAADWNGSRDFDLTDLRRSDYPAIASVFAQFDALPVRGGTIRENGALRAFSLYSQQGDTAFCHFEKAARGHEDFYAAIRKLTLANSFPEVRWLNSEEDMGIPGLRQAKRSYKPDRMVQKYEVTLTRRA